MGGVHVRRRGGLGEWGTNDKSMGEMGKDQSFSNLFLKPLTEGAVTTEAVSQFQYFTTLTENANPLRAPPVNE